MALAAIFIYVLLWLGQTLVNEFKSSFRTEKANVTGSFAIHSDCGLRNITEEDLKAWLRKEEPAQHVEEDLFRHVPIARNLLHRLNRGENTIALQGEFGSGKSSICAFIRQLAASERCNRYIFVQASCWGFEDTSKAQEDLISALLREVGKEVDCLAIRALPNEYLDAVKKEVGWLGSFLRSGDRRKPLEQLQQMSPLLSAIDKTVVIFIDDIDRNGESFDLSRIQALLVQFREVRGISFVLSISSGQNVDFARLCDFLETVQLLEPEQTLPLIDRTREMLLRENPPDIFVDAVEPLAGDGGNYANLYNNLSYYVSWQLCVARLLNTPRSLKHALRRFTEAWPRLKGEVYIDDLLRVCVLRAAAPEVFEYFAENFRLFKAAKEDDSNLRNSAKTRIRQRLRERWRQTVRRRDFDETAAAWLLHDLDPESAAGTGISSSHVLTRQSMQSERREVYARRLFTEVVSDSEVSDQRVLKLLQESNTDNRALRMLAELIVDDKPASDAFEHLGRVVGFDKKLPLLSQVYEVIRERHGARFVENNSPGFFAPWRMIGRFDRPQEFKVWLLEELKKCMPRHLRLLTTIYYYWLGTDHHTAEEREEARLLILDTLRSEWSRLPSIDIAAGFDPAWAYTLFHIVFTSDFEKRHTVPYGAAEDWAWMGKILLGAARAVPEVILPQLLIAVDSKSSRPSHLLGYDFDQGVVSCWFGSEVTDFMGLVAHGFDIHPETPAQTAYILKLAVEKARGEVEQAEDRL